MEGGKCYKEKKLFVKKIFTNKTNLAEIA